MKKTESSSADDEGEPASTANYLPRLLFLFIFSSCTFNSTNNELPLVIMPVAQVLPATEKESPPPLIKKKKIYLTFDDGPNKGTRQVLRVINEEQVPVSFFIVGEHVYGSKEQQATWDSLQQSEWVEICNHSYSHANNRFSKFYNNDSAVVADFRRTEDSLQLNNKIARTPGRNIWRTATVNATDIVKSKSAADSLYNAGFLVVGWDIEWHFNNSLKLKQSSDEMIRQVDSAFFHNRTKTPDHMVLLTHDQSFADSTDVASLRHFIQCLKTKSDYQIEFVSRYPGIKQ